MKHPDKWRDTVDVLTLPLCDVRVLEVLGYPHAGNDVFHCRVLCDGKEVNAFIKVERQFGADIANEVAVIQKLPFAFVPRVLEYSLDEPHYVITKEAVGERLSMLVKDDSATDARAYFAKQAAVLSDFHNLQIDCEPVKDRRFFHVPPEDFFVKHRLEDVFSFLSVHSPGDPTKCIVHGDFHYANILWEGGCISCVLDYELSGLGIREFDMAWSVFLRPGQEFCDAWDDVRAFLGGYRNEYCMRAFCYRYITIAAHFFPMGDEAYQNKVRNLIENAVAAYHAV